jgi:hypothetical protein
MGNLASEGFCRIPDKDSPDFCPNSQRDFDYSNRGQKIRTFVNRYLYLSYVCRFVP